MFDRMFDRSFDLPFAGSPETETPPPGHHLRKKNVFFNSGPKNHEDSSDFNDCGPKSSQGHDLFFEKKIERAKKTNKRTKKPNEQTKNRIVQVVVIVGGVSGRRGWTI